MLRQVATAGGELVVVRQLCGMLRDYVRSQQPELVRAGWAAPVYYWIVSLSVAWLLAVFGSLTPAGTLTLAVFEMTVPELPLINPVAL